MKDIYFVLFDLKMGGIEVSVVNAANGLTKRGYRVTIICLMKNNIIDRLINRQVKVIYISNLSSGRSILNKIKWRIIAQVKLRRFLRHIKDSVIVSTTNYFSVLLSTLPKNGNLYIAQQHHEYIKNNKLINDIRTKYLNIDYLFLLTEDMVEEMKVIIENYNNTLKPVYIPNILTKYHNNNSNSLNIVDHYCLSVGRLSKEKGFDRLINIWQYVKQKTNGNLKLYIIGEGEQRQFLENRIDELDLKDTVKLLGLKSNQEVRQYMSKAICYCMPSYTEAFGIVLVEALGAGLPQVAFDVRFGPRNIIIDEQTGYLINDNDTKRFANVVVNIYENEKLKEFLSANSLKRSNDFSEDAIIPKWEKIIKEVR